MFNTTNYKSVSYVSLSTAKGLITLYRKTRDGADSLKCDHLIEYFIKMGRTYSCHTRSEHCTWHKRKLALVQ